MTKAETHNGFDYGYGLGYKEGRGKGTLERAWSKLHKWEAAKKEQGINSAEERAAYGCYSGYCQALNDNERDAREVPWYRGVTQW